MRIIVGRFKGKKIEAPRGVLSRPPLAIIRESIFNMLGPAIEGGRVLDLFAGSGSLGIEAISRGAREAHFVDSAGRCVAMIGRNAEHLGISGQCRITRKDVIDFIRAWRGDPYDVVFVDPPFLSGHADRVVKGLQYSQLTAPGSTVIARTHWREEIDVPEGYSVIKRRKFGESVVLFLSAVETEAAT